MHTLTMWANRHDYAKLILITLVMIPGMLLSVTVNECRLSPGGRDRS